MQTERTFRAEKLVLNGVATVMLYGAIDEDIDLTPLEKEDPLILNFRNIDYINSCGIRLWVSFMTSMAEKRISYQECPPVIVRQMNIVPSFKLHAHVQSVYTPYICTACEATQLVLLSESVFSKPNLVLKRSTPCSSCKKGKLEFDAEPDQYFAFSKG